MNLQKEKEKLIRQISIQRYWRKEKKLTLEQITRKIEIIDWMMKDWGNPPYDTSGSLRI